MTHQTWLRALAFTFACVAIGPAPLTARDGENAAAEPALTPSRKTALADLLDLERIHRDRVARLKCLHSIATDEKDAARVKGLEKLADAEMKNYRQALERHQRELGTRLYARMLTAMGMPAPKEPVDETASLRRMAKPANPAGGSRTTPQNRPVSGRADPSTGGAASTTADSTKPDVKKPVSTKKVEIEQEQKKLADENRARNEELTNARGRVQTQQKESPEFQERQKRIAEQRQKSEERRAQRKAGAAAPPNAGTESPSPGTQIDPAPPSGDATTTTTSNPPVDDQNPARVKGGKAHERKGERAKNRNKDKANPGTPVNDGDGQ